MMLVWLVGLLGIGYLLYRSLAGGMQTKSASDPALEELRLAYARGDLSEEEFEQRRRTSSEKSERPVDVVSENTWTTAHPVPPLVNGAFPSIRIIDRRRVRPGEYLRRPSQQPAIGSGIR